MNLRKSGMMASRRTRLNRNSGGPNGRPRHQTVWMPKLADQTVDPAIQLLLALVYLSSQEAGGWVATGALADTLGISVGDSAARLRAAARLGLCTPRASLLYGMTWRPSAEARRLAARM